MADDKDIHDLEREGWSLSPDVRAANEPAPRPSMKSTLDVLIAQTNERIQAEREAAGQPKKRKRSTMRDPQGEDLMQIQFFKWARLPETLAVYPELRWIHHPANGGGRSSRVEGAFMKRLGVTAGISDIFLPVARCGYHGWYVELKFGRNDLTDEQGEFLEFAREQGYWTAEIRDDWLLARDRVIAYLLDKLPRRLLYR